MSERHNQLVRKAFFRIAPHQQDGHVPFERAAQSVADYLSHAYGVLPHHALDAMLGNMSALQYAYPEAYAFLANLDADRAVVDAPHSDQIVQTCAQPSIPVSVMSENAIDAEADEPEDD